MSGKVREYEGKDIVVKYDVKRCIHAEECVRGLPNVFVRGRRPWVDPDATAADDVAKVVMRCPTGALWFERKDGGMAEPVPEENTAEISRDGPVNMTGDIAIVSGTGELVEEVKRVRCVDAVRQTTSRSATAATRRRASKTPVNLRRSSPLRRSSRRAAG